MPWEDEALEMNWPPVMVAPSAPLWAECSPSGLKKNGCLPQTFTPPSARTRLIAGYAGWGPGQLEYEIKENSWLTGAVSDEIVFDISIESRWDVAVRKMGIDPNSLSQTAGHA